MDYNLAKRLKDAGFPQLRNEHARYYINEDTIAYFDDIKNAFEAKNWDEARNEVVVNWMDNFCYVPELIDFVGVKTYQISVDSQSELWVMERERQAREVIKRTEDAIQTEDNKLDTEKTDIAN